MPGRAERVFFIVSLSLGLLPLIAGTGVFNAWVFTRNMDLPFIGLAIIPIGIACVVAGSVCLIIYARLARSNPRASKRSISRRIMGVVALYVLDFIAAAGCVFGAFAIGP